MLDMELDVPFNESQDQLLFRERLLSSPRTMVDWKAIDGIIGFANAFPEVASTFEGLLWLAGGLLSNPAFRSPYSIFGPVRMHSNPSDDWRWRQSLSIFAQ
jgi:hypothetical protein